MAKSKGSWVVGTTLTIRATCKDEDGQLADPGTLTLYVKPPTNDLLTPTPAQESLGVWKGQFTPDEPGVWRFRWEGTGVVTAHEEGYLQVFPHSF